MPKDFRKSHRIHTNFGGCSGISDESLGCQRIVTIPKDSKAFKRGLRGMPKDAQAFRRIHWKS
eukprot:8678984-Pyramimonas_sp.AAC.1